MLSHRCPECGLDNIPERTTCKRCRAPLSPAHGGGGPSPLQPPITITNETTGIAVLLPTRSFTVFTPQPIETVRARLRQALAQEIERGTRTRWMDGRHTYAGSIVGDSVHLSGPHASRGWSLDATGTLQTRSSGTAIFLQVQPTGTSLFMLIFGIGFWLVVVLVQASNTWIVLGSLVIAAFIYAIMTIGIKVSASDSASIIAELLTPDLGAAPPHESHW